MSQLKVILLKLISLAYVCCLGISVASAQQTLGDGQYSITLRSEPGDHIGGGRTVTYTPRDGWFYAFGFWNDRGGVEVDFFSFDYSEHLYVLFHAPQQEELQAGRFYTGTTNFTWPSTPTPALEAYSNLGYCQEYRGAFYVLQADYTPDGKLERFAAELEVRCEELMSSPDEPLSAPALRGSIRVNYRPYYPNKRILLYRNDILPREAL